MSFCFKCFFLVFQNVLETYCKLSAIKINLFQNIFLLFENWLDIFGWRQEFQVLGLFLFCFVLFCFTLCKICQKLLNTSFSFSHLFIFFLANLALVTFMDKLICSTFLASAQLHKFLCGNDFSSVPTYSILTCDWSKKTALVRPFLYFSYFYLLRMRVFLWFFA